MPVETRNSLVQRAARQEKLLHYFRQTEVAQVVLQVRRERKALEKLFETAAEAGDVENAATLHACISRNREHILRLAGVPQAPKAAPKEKPRERPCFDVMAVSARVPEEPAGD